MGFGLGVLGLSADAFWAMTLKELAAALTGRFGPAPAAPPSRADLAALIERFPDARCASAAANPRGAC